MYLSKDLKALRLSELSTLHIRILRSSLTSATQYIAKTLIVTIAVLLPLSSASNAMMHYRVGEPIVGLRDNSAIDIIEGGGYIWLATSRGLSATSDRGTTWITYDSRNGLNANDVSAFAFGDGRLLAATAHNVVVDGQLIPYGDGFNTTIDFGASFDTSKPVQANFASMLAYDVAVVDSIAFAACFAGGLIRSFDSGRTWGNIFADSLDSIDLINLTFERRTNLYYSVVADTFSTDTLQVWAGSAAGIHRYMYIDPSIKLAGTRTYDLAYDSTAVWFAVDGGLSRGITIDGGVSYRFRSWNKKRGVNADFFTAVEAVPGMVVAGGWDASDDQAQGFSISNDGGQSWISSSPAQAVGGGHFINEIAIADQVVFAACSHGGLIRTIDHGDTWLNLQLTDDTSSAKPYNRFYSLYIDRLDGDSLALWAGTDSGIVLFSFDDAAGTPVSKRYIPFADTDSTGGHVEAVFVWLDSDSVKTVWAATHPVETAKGISRVLKSTDYGTTWTLPLQEETAYDIGVWKNTLFITTENGILYSDDGETFQFIDGSVSFAIDSIFRRMESAGDILWMASQQLAIRTKNVAIWLSEPVNTDPLKFDRHTVFDTTDGLTGNFVTALGLQYDNGRKTVWAATQKTEEGENGVTVSENSGADWIVTLPDVIAWNFAFDGGDAYVAASGGVYERPDGESGFARLSFTESERRFVSDDAEFYAVRIIGDSLWVGSSDGIAVRPLDSDTSSIFREFRNVASKEGGEPYASPVPASSSHGLGFVRFHYYLPTTDYVTIKVYDFAMNLVKTVTDNVVREPRETSDQDDEDRWDLRNDNGDLVAAGVYIFMIELASGDKQWGKLMVLP